MSQKKLVWNSESLDWAYWANLQSISAKDACWLVCGIDPNICNNDSIESKYYLSDEKRIEIKNAITQIESDIRAGKEKEYNSPWDWVCWAEGKGIPVPTKFHALAFEAKKKSIHVHKAQPLEKISEESLTWYLKQDSWAYYEAIFLIQGYNPPGFLEGFDEVRAHFPEMYVMLQRSIEIGAIGREVNQAGQKNFIDTPERWMVWAKHRGCNTDHLDHFNGTQEHVPAIGTLKKINVDDRSHLKTDTRRRREKQVAAIVQQATAFEYPLLSIPYGGKNKIKDECLKDLSLFTDASFDHAWKKAKKEGLIEVDNVDSYRKSP